MKQYVRDRILKVLESVGYVILNGTSDSPVYYLQHERSKDILLLDKFPDKFPEDYVKLKIQTADMNFSVFQYLYEKSKEPKKQSIKRK